MLLIHDLFIKSAEENSAKIALIFGDQKITYGELHSLSNQIANRLVAHGVKENDIVGVCKNRSIHMVASLIAILKVGASYLPLDPMYPKDRLRFMLDHSKAKKIIIDKDLISIFSDSNNESFIFTENLNEEIKFKAAKNAELCYVIYTSGSTGKPKGVAMGHRPLVNLIKWQNNETNLGNTSITLQFTPISFDVHFQEIFSTLTAGGILVLISEDLRLNTLKLIDELNDKKVNRLYLPFVALNHIAESAAKFEKYPLYLKEVTTAGEQLKITKEIRELFSKLSDCRLFNHYGPSETHVVTSKLLQGDVSLWPDLPSIGSEIDNCTINILDEKLNIVKDGDIGELYIFGEVLAKGYLHSEELTKERFITTQFGLAYKTGDLGKRVGLDIEFLGRSDNQVKIRGYRIEPAEIEIQITNLLNGKKAYVKPISEIGIDTYLCVYLYEVESSEVESLKKKLKDFLPDYMHPRAYVKIDSIPLTPSGKVDYKLLPIPKLSRPELENDLILPENETEEKLVYIWKDLLKIDDIGVLDSFFDLGGNSLSAIKMLIEINNNYQKDLNITDVFSLRTIRSLANRIDSRDEDYDIDTGIDNKDELIRNEKIAIVAMTGRFPGANNIDEFWKNLESVKDSIEKFKKENVSQLISKEVLDNSDYVFCKAELPGSEFFDHKFFGVTPKEADAMDPQQRKFLELCHEVLEIAAIAPNKFRGSIGIFAGTGNSKYSRIVDLHPDLKNIVGDFNTMLGLEKDYISTRVAFKLNLNGPAISVHTACSTSLVAIIEAVNHLRLKNCDVALAGGISISGLKNQGHLYTEGGILTKDGTCRPYDKNATGTIFSDGAGVIVLKRLTDAIANKDNILAVISGVGINNDGADKSSFTAPSVLGQQNAILKAMRDANISAEEVGMVEGHGTATPVGDPIEVEALTRAFQKSSSNRNYCYLTSLKSNVGHLTAAAGVASVIKATLAINNKKIPGTCHFNEYNQLIDFKTTPFKVTSSTEEFKNNSNNKRIAGVSSFGVGGTNAHIIIESYEQLKPTTENNKIHLIKISSKNKEGLNQLTTSTIDFIKFNEKLVGNLAFAYDLGRNDYQFKKCLLVDGRKNNSIEFVETEGNIKNILFGFPGQGSHYPQMGRELYENNRVFREYLDLIIDKINANLNIDLKQIIWGETSDLLLAETKNSQPAIFAIELALAKTYLYLDVKPTHLIGHSIGEFAAAVVAEIFDEETAIKMICKRASLMQSLETGKMLSTNIDIVLAEELCNKFSIDIAAINAHGSIVFSGEILLIDALKSHLESLGYASIELKTSHAFHSKMMGPAVLEFSKYIEQFNFKIPKLKIINTSNSKFNIWEKEYWSTHIKETVDFYAAQSAILNIKNAVFIEIGPRSILTSYLKKNKQLEIKYLCSLGNKLECESVTFLKSIAELWCYGVYKKAFEWNYSDIDRYKIPTPTYQFEKHYHWLNIDRNNEESMSLNQNSKLKLKLAKIFEDTSGIEILEADFGTSFLELGMDSLFLTQISMQLKKELKVNVGFRQLLENYDSINLLSEHLQSQVADEFKLEKKVEVKAEDKLAAQMVNIPKIEKVSLDLNSIGAPQHKPISNIKIPMIERSSGPVNNLVDLVSKQLDLMQQQIILLSGQNIVINTNNEYSSGQLDQPVVSNVEVEQLKTDVPGQDLKEVKKRGADIKKAKDSFGAQAKIVIEKSSALSAETQSKIKDFCNKYNQKTKSSKKFAQDNRKNHADPRVVTGFKPESKEVVYPIVVKKSYLQNLWDLDDNKYIDMTCGFGSNFFGNGNEKIKKYVLKQIEDGIEIGPQHPLVSEVSNLINELTGNERSAFCNTGSEAVLGAMRLARTVTGREKIVVFSGSYHGINDEVIIRGSKNLNSIPAAPGINFSSVSNMIVLDYGTDESLEFIRKNASELAAVLVEPVQSRRSDFHPKEFLKEVREITLNSNTCLIFDEIITGFRIHPAGAQGYFGIRADLCTYGKIVGGGMPIGIISGKTEYMDALDGGFWQYGDDSTPTVGVTYFAGTFVRHPLALAAAKGALEILKEGGVELFNSLNLRSQKFADEINKMLKQNNVPIKMDNFGSLMKPKWVSDLQSGDLFFAALRFNGVHVYDGFPWFVNLAHTQEDLDQVLLSFNRSIKMMQEIGVFEKVADISSLDLDINKIVSHGSPMVGAKLGKDENGNPAWFIDDPQRPGKYLKIN